MRTSCDRRGWRLGTALGLFAALAASGCSTYKPLDQGSDVPWAAAVARAREAPAQGGMASAPPGNGAATGPVRVVALPGVPGAAAPAQPRSRPMQVTELSDPPAAVRPATSPPPSPAAPDVHEVAAGEALGRIAERYAVSLARLAEANGLEPPYPLQIGQKLRIPAEEAMAASHASAALPPAAADRRYVVRQGDVLVQIARRHAVPMQQLAAANDLEPPYALQVGQELQIPSKAQSQPPRAVAARAAPEPAPALAPTALPEHETQAGFLWPVEGKVIGRFGESDDGERRTGIIIAARKGAPVRAAGDGVVVYAGDAIRSFGRMVLVRHEDGYVTAYAHNSAILVNVGDAVERGQVIARVGDSGDVDAPQLHFEIRKGRTPIDPEEMLLSAATELASTH